MEQVKTRYQMNEIVNKFFLAGDKFMPEMHLRQPEFPYNTSVLFTKNNERVKQLKETGNLRYTEWPTKMSLFFFSNNFYKNRPTFKIFSLQLLEVYRILLVETTLESIIFYYTFSVIIAMFVPCTELLYDSTAATRTLKLSTTLLSISWRIRLISFLMMSSFVCELFSQSLSFRSPLRK